MGSNFQMVTRIDLNENGGLNIRYWCIIIPWFYCSRGVMYLSSEYRSANQMVRALSVKLHPDFWDLMFYLFCNIQTHKGIYYISVTGRF